MSRPTPLRPPVSPGGFGLALIVSLALWVMIIGGCYLLWQAVGL